MGIKVRFIHSGFNVIHGFVAIINDDPDFFPYSRSIPDILATSSKKPFFLSELIPQSTGTL